VSNLWNERIHFLHCLLFLRQLGVAQQSRLLKNNVMAPVFILITIDMERSEPDLNTRGQSREMASG
jgi:hypothetical protein